MQEMTKACMVENTEVTEAQGTMESHLTAFFDPIYNSYSSH